jgi:hypothetical protein
VSVPVIQVPMVAVDEQTESYVNLTFTDQNGNPYVPTQVQYRIDAVRQNVNVVPWTTAPTPYTPVPYVIVVPAASNFKQDADPVEMRQVSVKITAPGGSVRNDQQTYALIKVPVRT